MKQIRGYVFTIVAAAGFGAQPFLAKFVYSYGVGEVMLALLRVLCMTPVFGILGVLNRERFKIPVRYMLRIILLALTGAVLTTAMLFTAYNLIDTGTATTLNFTYPIFVLLLGRAAFKVKIQKHSLVSLIICIAGIVLFANPSGAFSWSGFFLSLASGITYGFYVLYLDKSKIMEHTGFYTYTFYFFLAASVMLLPIAGFSGELNFIIPTGGWMFILLFAIDGGILATVFLQIGIREIGSSKASILTALEPVTSIVLGVLFLQESLSIFSLIGIVLVIFSNIYLVFVPENRRKYSSTDNKVF
ncbi:putative DMT superfamily transporter inner membrane protein [uncultured Roseburia sp.]|uniref:DMT family transporter n=1 Tax=Brotonthovivens ammoniilytica TaxID=2981725 RepID=A0ABT2TIL3_9FIRM|nr:EamA family transporter [Brotonthovivens ammoniilytica]MCU6762055.1 DMT family transporter [Brotonthovivens ammoniilytica]SCI54287.1 putative DMT superfamily transporter inner membrane protein [uncultured Roseburia sp.]